MGYAVLHYSNNTALIGHVVHDIVGIVTGTYTSTASLSPNATTNLCSIVNTAGRGNWEFVFPATHGTRSSSTNQYVLRAPCISSGSKYKFVRIQGVSSATFGVSTSNLNNTGNSGSNGINMQGCTAAASATSVSNETPYNTYNSASGDYYAGSKPLIYGPYFYISWSSRHLIILAAGINGVAASDYVFFACLEHTETSITTFRNVAPFCFLTYMGVNYANWVAPQFVSDSVRWSFFNMMNHYNPATTVASGITNWQLDTGTPSALTDDMPMISNSSNTYPTVYTKNSSGSNAMFMQPLFFHQHWRGIPHQYITNLCDVYRVPVGLGNVGDLLTVGADTYVYFPCRDNYGLAVRRA